MRLVCPNCEAKYEVPDDAIPDTGRDVQCTNCNHTWFQMRGRAGSATFVASTPEPEPAPVPVVEPAPVAEPDPEELADLAVQEIGETPVVSEPVDTGDVQAETPVEEAATLDQSSSVDVLAGAADGPVADRVEESEANSAAERTLDLAKHEPEPDTVAEADDAVQSPFNEETATEISQVVPQTAGIATAAYAVDESVLAILREEAEREANARRAEALESQTDMGLDQAPARKGASTTEVDTKPSARRDLLPDVEEINSTLRPSEVQTDADGTPDFVAAPPEAPRGFRSGFLSLMTVAILAAALYLIAPRLAMLVPALAGPLETYVSLIDSLRLGLDGVMRSATVAISDS